MSVEVEMKFRVGNVAELRSRLDALGAAPGAPAAQTDTYLSHPGRHFAETDEALRIRSDQAGSHLTYKGPKWGGPTKTREEIEIPLGAGAGHAEALATLFERLGFQPLAVLRKTRTPYHVESAGRPLQVALDQAGELGTFAEVETIAETEADVPAAQQAVLDLARRLGLTDLEPRSYLRMTLERQGR